MARKHIGGWATVVGVLSLAACCALLPATGVGAGLLAALIGAAVRFWPVTVLGALMAAGGGIWLARTILARRRAISKRRAEGSGANDRNQ